MVDKRKLPSSSSNRPKKSKTVLATIYQEGVRLFQINDSKKASHETAVTKTIKRFKAEIHSPRDRPGLTRLCDFLLLETHRSCPAFALEMLHAFVGRSAIFRSCVWSQLNTQLNRWMPIPKQSTVSHLNTEFQAQVWTYLNDWLCRYRVECPQLEVYLSIMHHAGYSRQESKATAAAIEDHQSSIQLQFLAQEIQFARVEMLDEVHRMEECFELLIPKFVLEHEMDEDDEDAGISWEDVEESKAKEEVHRVEDIVSEYGLGSTAYALCIEVDAQSSLSTKNADNAIVFQKMHETRLVIQKRFQPQVQEWQKTIHRLSSGTAQSDVGDLQHQLTHQLDILEKRLALLIERYEEIVVGKQQESS